MRMNGRHDSFSSEDEVPLKFCAKNESDWNNSYDTLIRRSVVDCEFCDQLFNSRYQSLIHNATHIIIPLLNQTVLECEECHFCFTSVADLQRHTLNSHPTPTPTNNPTPNPTFKPTPTLTFKPTLTVAQLQKTPRLKMRNRLQFEDDPVDDLLTDLTTNCSVTLNRTQEEERIKKEYLVDEDGIMTLNRTRKKERINKEFLVEEDEIMTLNRTRKKERINKEYLVEEDEITLNRTRKKERIKKEFDRIEEDELDYPSEEERIKKGKLGRAVKREMEDPDWCIGWIKKDNVTAKKRIKENLPYKNDHSTIPDPSYFNGDEVYKVQKEYDCFTQNNQELVDKCESESIHYEDLRRSMAVHCKHCKQNFKDRFDLAVHQATHLRIDRPTVIYHCTGDTDTAQVEPCQTKHHPDTGPTRSDQVLEICDLCYKFLQPKSHRRYLKTGVVTRPGERSTCSKCSREFFELNRVTRVQVMHTWRERKRKRLTNDQRLKNIRHRLKIANKILKLYSVVSLVLRSYL